VGDHFENFEKAKSRRRTGSGALDVMMFVQLLALFLVVAVPHVSALLELSVSQEAFTSAISSDFMNKFHYGDPRTGCMTDEVPIKIQGVRGGVCTAHCSQVDGSCPQDKPDGAVALPRCVLENRATGEKFCALMCSAGMSCGEGASCKIVQGTIGICTWDDVYSSLRASGQ
jgi:hypothetical protein